MIKKEVLIEETRSFLKRPLLFEHSLAVAEMAEQLADDCLNQRLNIRHSSKEANKKFTDGSVSKFRKCGTLLYRFHPCRGIESCSSVVT